VSEKLFAGEQFDSTLDQYYLRARYYDPSQGRFTQQDTWMGRNHDPVTLHKYLYANADPGNMVDPSGKFSLGSVMSAVNSLSTLTTVAQTTYSVFQLATGEEELTASQVGSMVLLNLITRGNGATIKNVRGLIPSRYRKQFDDCFGNSFTPDTYVFTESGGKEISKIELGERVLTFDEQSGEQVYNEVIHVIKGQKEYDLVVITFSNGEKIEVTPNHPLYVNSKWDDAENVKEKDVLAAVDGAIKVVSKEIIKRETFVYNLTVENNHNYYVSKAGVLAHNCSFNVGSRGSTDKLRKIHSDNTLKSGSNKYSFEYWHKQSTEDILRSLKPGSGNAEALKVKRDGRIFNGNTRIYVLEQRGYDIDSLLREIID
jgi:RHS repeat-associated protein